MDRLILSRCSITIFVAIGCLGCRAAIADVVVSGGTAVQQQQISDVYNKLPLCCRDGCKICVQLFSDREMNAYIASGDPQAARSISLSSVDGIYQNDEPTITLRAASHSPNLSATFAHEYGHYIWQRHLSRTDQREYVKLYDRQKKSGSLVTTYAAASVEEGFAEAFSYFVINKPILVTRDSMSCCYLDRLLGERL